MDDLISRQAAIDELVRWGKIPDYNDGEKTVIGSAIGMISTLPSARIERLTDDDFETIRIHLNAYKENLCNQQRWKEAEEYQRIIDRFMAFASAEPERKKGEWTTHEVACLLAEVMGDDCACNVNGNDEWLPFVCEFAETTCPDVVGVACWEQWLVHRKEKEDAEIH